jgi:aryl-alcohol dehydrogenase-like predicted oxidoreductase
VLAECQRLDLAFIPYFPLASGLLTGKYKKGLPAAPGTRLHQAWAASVRTAENEIVVEKLSAFAKKRRHTLLELAVSWLAQQPRVASIIAGATSPEQVRANAAAMTWRLTDAEVVEIDRLTAKSA